MIKQLRIDDRLFHGEIVALWISTLGVDSVVVADDVYASNQMNIMTAQLSKPKFLKLNILTMEKAIAYLQDPAHAREKILVTCANAQNALALCKAVEGIPEVNAACMRFSEGKVQVGLKAFVDQKDLDDLQEIENMGKSVISHTVPANPRSTLADMIKKAK